MRAVSLDISMTFSNDFPMKFCLYPLPNNFSLKISSWAKKSRFSEQIRLSLKANE